MSKLSRFLKVRRLLLLAVTVAALAAAPAGAQQPIALTAHQCRPGNAPLPGGASTNPASRAGLVARGWDVVCQA
jgi:invasion protein IalB